MRNQYKVIESTETVLSEGTKQLQMVRGACRGVELRRKVKKKLKAYATGEKNGQKMVKQVSDHKIRYLGL